MSEVDLFPLKRLVIDKGQGVDANVNLLGNLGNGVRLGIPVDLRVDEVVVDTKSL